MMQNQPLTGKWQFQQVGKEEWLPANVPGSVHTDLMAIGRIPDPFVADNEKRVQWVAESDWVYRTSFTPHGRPAFRRKGFSGLRRVGHPGDSRPQRT